MQAVAEQQTAITTNNISYHQIAREYITSHVGEPFIVSPDGQMSSTGWWSLVLATVDGHERPIGVGRVRVDIAKGAVVALTASEVQTMREKAAIAQARRKDELPIGVDGFVLAEYARKQANRYLQENLTMFYGAIEPVLVKEELTLWQVTIQFKMGEVGPFTLGTMDVDALTGIAISLTNDEITRIRERTRGIIRVQAPETTTPI